MVNRFKPYQQTTIPGYISAGKSLSISESSMAYKTVIDDEIVVSFHNVITKYYNIIKGYIVTCSLSDEDFLRYKNKPNLFCYDIYGTPELMSSLLYINNMTSITEFTKPTFKRFSDNIMDIVKELMTLNENELKKNRNTNKIK